MRVRRESVTWKDDILNQWDDECYESNQEIKQRKISSSTCDSLPLSIGILNEIKHYVMEGETLEGISLIYGVTINDIKHRNNMSSSEIYFISELVIPNPRLGEENSLEDENEEKINELMEILELDSEKRTKAEKLLSESFWDVGKAVQKFNEDLEWEKKYSHILCCFDNNKYKSSFFHQHHLRTI